MLSIGAMGHGQGDYYTDLAREDYYLEGGEPPGVWWGSGAQAIGLNGCVTADELRPLLEGFAPEGAGALIQNAGSRTHQPGWDLTFSAPKSVSVLWSVCDEETRHTLQQIHFEAVRAALDYLQESAGYTRRGKGGTERELAQLVVATFEHGTSRALQPLLHTHALVANVAVRGDGTTGTILSRPVYEHKMAAGAIYRAESARLQAERLGLGIERNGALYEVQGIPSDLVEASSTRRHEIEAEMSARGVSGARAAAIAALGTRKAKEYVPRQTLFARWQEVGEAHGFGLQEARRLLQDRRDPRPSVDRTELVRAAIEHITERSSHFTERDVVRHTAELAPGTGYGAVAIREAVRQHLGDSREIVHLQVVKGERRFTTTEMLALEQRLLARSDHLAERGHLRVPQAVIESVLARYPSLSEEQRRAALHTTAETSGIAIVSGMAGAGKTAFLSAARECWEACGYEVLGTAQMGKAARGLEETAGIPSRTVARLLRDLEPDPRSGRPRLTIGPRTVLVADEAGVVGTRQLDALLEKVERAGGKSVLVGDAAQLQSIEAGGAFKALGDRHGQATLVEIRRQRDAWARQAVHDFAEGRAEAALRAYAERGLLHVSGDRRTAMAGLVADWRREGVRRPEESLILTASRADAAVLNRLAQAERRQDGALGESFVRVREDVIHQRDRVVFTRNSRLYGVNNGDLGTVALVDAHEGVLHVNLDRGERVTIPLDHYQHVQLGYAVTTHKGQGVTVERAYVLVGGPMQDRELTYTQASRARQETRIYADYAEVDEEITALSRQMNVSHQKTLAVELAPEMDL